MQLFIIDVQMRANLLILSLLWSVTFGCKSSPPPRESCEYCPECARVSIGHIGGISSNAIIQDVRIYFKVFVTLTNNSFKYLEIFKVPLDGKLWL